jgi:hypothetical protein
VRSRLKTWSGALVSIPATLVFAACGGMSIDSAQDPNVDLTTMSTFEWMDREQPEVSRQATREGLDERIRGAVEAGLTGRGLRKAEEGQADLILTYFVRLDGDYDIQLVNTYPDDRWGIDRGWERYTERSGRVMESGTLVLDAFDASTGKLAWRGVAEAEIDRSRSPEDRAALVQQAVRKLLEEFPTGD